MTCTAKCITPEGTCRDYHICNRPKYATIDVVETTVEKCKNQPMSWLEQGIVLVALLAIAIVILTWPRLGM